MNIKCSNVIINNNQFSFSISTDTITKKFYFNYPVTFSESAIKECSLLPSLMCLYIACQSGKETTINIPKQTKYYKTLIDALPTFITPYNSYLMRKPIYKPNITIKYNVEIDSSNLKEHKNTKYDSVVSASGGKDSLIAKATVEDIGYKPALYQVGFATIAYNRGTKPLSKINYKNDLYVANTNINRMKDFFKQPEFRTDNFEGLPYMMYRDYITMSHTIHGLILSEILNVKHVFCSFEFVNLFFKYQDKYIVESLSESPIFTKLLQKCYEEHKDNKIISSPIFHLPHPTVLKLIDTRYYNKCNNFSSCITQINRWCYKCAKDLRIWMLWKAQNIDSKKYGFNETKLFNNSKAFKINSQMSESYYNMDNEALEWVKYNIIKNNPTTNKYVVNFLSSYLSHIKLNSQANFFGYKQDILSKITPSIYSKKLKQIMLQENINRTNYAKEFINIYDELMGQL